MRRHVSRLSEEYPDKEIYGVFIAPKINNNTTETFRRGTWYEGETLNQVKIVPLKLSHLIKIVERMRTNRLLPSALKDLLFAASIQGA